MNCSVGESGVFGIKSVFMAAPEKAKSVSQWPAEGFGHYHSHEQVPGHASPSSATGDGQHTPSLTPSGFSMMRGLSRGDFRDAPSSPTRTRGSGVAASLLPHPLSAAACCPEEEILGHERIARLVGPVHREVDRDSGQRVSTTAGAEHASATPTPSSCRAASGGAEAEVRHTSQKISQSFLTALRARLSGHTPA